MRPRDWGVNGAGVKVMKILFEGEQHEGTGLC